MEKDKSNKCDNKGRCNCKGKSNKCKYGVSISKGYCKFIRFKRIMYCYSEAICQNPEARAAPDKIIDVLGGETI